MRTVVLCSLLLFTPILFAAPAPFAKPNRPDRSTDVDRLQGAWTRTAAYVWRSDGWQVVSAISSDAIIRGNQFAWTGGFTANDMVERFTLHAGTPLHGIDFTSERTHEVERGVYKIDADVLTIVLAKRGEQRPFSLDNGHLKLVFRRKR